MSNNIFKMKASSFMVFVLVVAGTMVLEGQSRHSTGSRFQTYEGRVMCGYQGWFRAPGDGSGRGWGHYAANGRFGDEYITIDLWPDIREYKETYDSPYTMPDGKNARLFSSWDESTVDLHFRWMQEYGIDGVFMQRFFNVTRTPESRREGNVILGYALRASRKYNRAIAVMYDLSGLKAKGEDCSSVIEDWKQLVDQLKITSGGNDQTYLYHRGKPLVAIWGLGFPDRPYNIRDIGVDKLIDFLKNDPVYGGCSVMLGVPAYFRDLKIDCLPNPFLHELIQKSDIVMPWTVQRFTPLLHNEKERIEAHVRDDIKWCNERGIDYAANVYPGFTWYNLSRFEFGGIHPVNQIPRQKGRFFWMQISAAIKEGTKMLYVSMFDEMDEGTAIFKCADTVPQGNFKLQGYEGMPSDYYLWLTGMAGKMLRKDMPFSDSIPERR
jgi:hypothetical protein